MSVKGLMNLCDQRFSAILFFRCAIAVLPEQIQNRHPITLSGGDALQRIRQAANLVQHRSNSESSVASEDDAVLLGWVVCWHRQQMPKRQPSHSPQTIPDRRDSAPNPTFRKRLNKGSFWSISIGNDKSRFVRFRASSNHFRTTNLECEHPRLVSPDVVGEPCLFTGKRTVCAARYRAGRCCRRRGRTGNDLRRTGANRPNSIRWR